MTLAMLFVPETPVRVSHRIDYLGALLLGVGVGLLIYASAFSGYRIGAIVGGLVLIGLFIAVERRTAEPLISLNLLRRPAVLLTLLLACMVGLIFNSNVALIAQMIGRATARSGYRSGPDRRAVRRLLRPRPRSRRYRGRPDRRLHQPTVGPEIR